MLKKTITFTDFNGEEVTEDHYFHLSQAELVELEMSQKGGMSESLRQIIAAEDGGAIISEFKSIILKAYGKKSDDGRRFIKNQQLREEFESSEAYSTLFMEIVTDPEKATEFVNGIMPAKLVQEVQQIPNTSREEVLQSITRAQLMNLPQEEAAAMRARIASGEVKVVE